MQTRWRFEFARNRYGDDADRVVRVPRINIEGSPANFEGRFEMLDGAIKKTIANIKAAAESSVG